MTKMVLVPLADGSEEIEAVCIIDTLRRAGAEVTVAAAADRREITASRGVRLVADRLLSECRDAIYDLIALPGGMPGAERLRDSEVLKHILARHVAAGRLYAAICAAPAVVLQPLGFLAGRRATCHPSFASQLPDRSRVTDRVFVDGPCVTSRGPGTALEFALTLVALLYSEEKAVAVAEPMILT